MNLVDRAFNLANERHANQFDKAGIPYIEHPITVAESFDDSDLKIVALLHDIVEDADVTLDELKSLGFRDKHVRAINAITKRDGEQYEEYLSRVKNNYLARKVKIADISHNMDTSRLTSLGAKDIRRLEKYKKALEYLEEQ